jgi:hypothetical protein
VAHPRLLDVNVLETAAPYLPFLKWPTRLPQILVFTLVCLREFEETVGEHSVCPRFFSAVRQPLLEKREKWRTPGYLVSTFGNSTVIFAALKWPTRHWETPLYAAGGRIFILRTLIWCTLGAKGKAHCAISLAPTHSQKTRMSGAPTALVVQAGKASAKRLFGRGGRARAPVSPQAKSPALWNFERGFWFAVGVLPARTPALRD